MDIPGVKLEAGDRVLVIKADGTWVEVPALTCVVKNAWSGYSRDNIKESLERWEKTLDWSWLGTRPASVIDDVKSKLITKALEKLTLDKETDLVNTASGPSRNPCGYCSGVGQVRTSNISVKDCPICGGKGVR